MWVRTLSCCSALWQSSPGLGWLKFLSLIWHQKTCIVLLLSEVFFFPASRLKLLFSAPLLQSLREDCGKRCWHAAVQGMCGLRTMTIQSIAFLCHFTFCKALARTLSHVVFITESWGASDSFMLQKRKLRLQEVKWLSQLSPGLGGSTL